VRELPPESPGLGMLPCTVEGHSEVPIMSFRAPAVGHPLLECYCPESERRPNALGPEGILIRALNASVAWENKPAVIRRADL